VNGWAIFLIVWIVLGNVLTISQIGKPRPILTSGAVAISTVLTIGLLWVVVLASTN
jgi:hypothetical protein